LESRESTRRKNSHVILTASKNNIKASGSARYKFLSVYWVNYAEDGSYTVRPVKEKAIFSKKSITFTLSNLMKKVQKWPNQSKVKSGFLATVVSKKNLAGKTKFNYLFIPASAVK
jgi:spore germination protein GerM